LAPDFKTIARFRKDNGKAFRSVCRQFGMLCQRLGLFAEALVAIDGSKFKAVNHRDRNFTSAKLARLRCLVIIDLKLTELNHVDVGQMHMYCNYAREHWTSRGESPPVGLILGTRANAAVARYAEVYIDVNDEMQRGAVDLA
jgi:hypothetical protein